jgi:aminocarboxymuconate-semialdehyde decarboxylase
VVFAGTIPLELCARDVTAEYGDKEVIKVDRRNTDEFKLWVYGNELLSGSDETDQGGCDMLKIDAFTHIIPIKYNKLLYKIAGGDFFAKAVNESIPTLTDLDARFRIMDKYDVMHVITLAFPTPEQVADPKGAVELAKAANDEMAELVFRYPERFPAAIATLPMNDMDAALKETDRAIKELRFRGVQICTSINGKALDSPEFWPLYEKMCEYNLPILLHPYRDPSQADYPVTEKRSKYRLSGLIGWPYETTAAMIRLVFSGVFDRHPSLKIQVHHCGGYIPAVINRVVGEYQFRERQRRSEGDMPFTKPLIDYFKMFYYDTAVYGHTPYLMCCYELCGADHMVFATDLPYDSQFGARYTRETIASIERMNISDLEKKKIFEDNVRKLMRLPV